jgi:hypothetical protein
MKLNVEGWLNKLYRRTESDGTVTAARKGYKAFRKFLAERGTASDEQVETLLDQLISKQVNVFKLLDDFAGWFSMQKTKQGRKYKSRTVRNRNYAAASFLRYHDVDIPRDTYRDKVTLPLATELEDEPVSMEDLRKLVLAASPLMRAVYLCNTSDGGRIGEWALTRVKDLDFDTDPEVVLVKKRASITKTDTYRTAFATDEAREALLYYIRAENKKPDDWLFFPQVPSPKRLRKYHTRMLKKLALDKKIEGPHTITCTCTTSGASSL